MNIQDRRKTLTVEELRRRYNLDALDKDRKAIKLQKDQLTKVDAELNDFVEITTKNLKELQNQVDGNITTWFFNGVPRVENEPSSNWTTDEEKINHLGDLYYDQDTGYAYRWAYENNIYVWSKIVDADVVEALAVANAAQDTADSKRRVFVVQPKPPYDIGDIWIKEDIDLYRCRASRSDGSFNTVDWIRATNYTDDTVALGTKAELDQFKTTVTENYVTNATLETTTNSIEAKVTEVYEYTTTVEDTVSGLSESVSNTIENVSKLTTDVDGITSRVSSTETKIEDITTTTQTSTGGNSLYITDSLESNALEYYIEGKSEQETRSGKNLFNGSLLEIGVYNLGTNGVVPSKITSTTRCAISPTNAIKVQPNTTYTMTIPSNCQVSIGELTTDKLLIKQSNWQTTITYTFTTSATTEYLCMNFIYGNSQTITDDILKTFTNSSQLEKGSTATEIEQYGASPSPDYPSEIKTVKGIRNLFDKDNVNILDGYYISTGGVIGTASGNKTLYIEVEPNTTYTIQKIVSNRFRVGCYSGVASSGTTLNNYKGNENGTILTITTDSTAKYLFVQYMTTDTNEQEILDSIMIEEGSIAHDYVPYGAWAKVKVTGKNLFDKDNANIMNGYVNPTNKYLSSEANGRTIYIKCKPNTTYTISKIKSARFTIGTTNHKPYYEILCNQVVYNHDATELTITTTSDDNYLAVFYYTSYYDTLTEEEIRNSIMIEENSTATEYEEYKENEVLIDMKKPNLFDGEYEIGGYSIADGTEEAYTDRIRAVNYVPVLPNTKYTYSIPISKSSIIIYYDENKDFITYEILFSYTTGLKEKTFKTPNNTKYIRWYVIYTDTNFQTQLYEGYEPYYELSSIGDTKDTLDIVNGQVIIDKKIGKVVLDGSEAITRSTTYDSHYRYNIPTKPSNIKLPSSNGASPIIVSNYFNKCTPNQTWGGASYDNDLIGISLSPTFSSSTGGALFYIKYESDETSTLELFKTWLSENNPEVYYELATPQQIILLNTQIPLFDGINHIALVDDLETTTSIKYYRNTPIAQDYVIQQQLDETNSNLSTTTDKTNQNTSDINTTNTNLNNNYYNKEQINAMQTTTTQNITTIRNTMEQSITSANASISKIQEEITNGVSKVVTTTGTFDENGLNISKTGEAMSSTMDWDGFEVVRDKGQITEAEVFIARSDGVVTENQTVRTYYIQEPIRQEKCVSITDGYSVGIGTYWTGVK